MQYILPKKGYLLQFVSYALKSLNLASFASGAAIPHIYFKDYGKCEISVPPLMEQSRIVAELDLLTGIIDKQKAQLKELDNLAQSIFYDMFGDPIENPKGWNVQLLKQHTTKIGSGATPKGGNESYKSEGIPLIRSLNVYNGTFKYKDLAHIDDEQAAALDNVILLSGDVLLNITGASVARCCIVPSDLVSGRVNQHVAILRPKDSLKSVFLCAQLISSGYQRKLLHDSKANGATREALTKSQLEGLPVIIPPLKLQQEFADKITAIASQKSAINLSMAETQKLLDYTMDKYFG
jgi:type I restriction enzyme S subunit